MAEAVMTESAGHGSPDFRAVWRALDALRATATPELAYQFALQVAFLRVWPASDGRGLARCAEAGESGLNRAWAWWGLDRTFGRGEREAHQARRLHGAADRSLAKLITEVARLDQPAGLFDACLDRYSARFGVGGDYFTPRPLARLMAGLAAPRVGERVLDPTCGSGRLLIAAEQWARGQAGGGAGALKLHGREIRPEARRAAAMNLVLNGLGYDLGDRAVDSLRAGSAGMSADVVLANPPLNAKDWGHPELSGEPRWDLGIPPKGNADFAWVQHVLSELAPQGRAVVLLPDSATRRLNTAESWIRRRLVERDLLAGVVALPARLFPHTRTGTTLWLFSKDKGVNDHWGLNSRVGEVLFVDARGLPTRTAQEGRRLMDEGIERICSTFAQWRGVTSARADRPVEEPGWCRSVQQDEIARHGYDLGPGSYVPMPSASGGIPLSESDGHRRKVVDALYRHLDDAESMGQQLRRVLDMELVGRKMT
ncbi:N-6 DNA methylase [Streptomyces sp. NPDC101206]|uniref:N-6 DNA methylase n=1 Tax=Streptomyces sp. NPDC101206 TaxID=3366128 RepID=UPI0038020683